MTYEFFHRHNAPYLTDAAIKKIWAARPFVNGPEDDIAARALRFAAQATADRFPETARVKGAAA